MIRDAEELADGSALRAEICIVGAGAAGIAIALQFLTAGRDVLLLESGGLQVEPEAQALYDGEVADPSLHPPAIRYRRRRFGGTTGFWGGRCVPFDAIDFERRDWIADSGWPFGLETLRPYYPRANHLLEAGAFAYTAGEAFARPLRPVLEGFASDRFTDDTLERFSCPTDFAARYRRRLQISRDVRVLLHASVTQLIPAPDGARVASLQVRTLNGRSLSVRAGTVVLATGGLEVPRLLLASRDRLHPDGLGNAQDWVGRNYMCHIAGTVGEFAVHGSPARVWHDYDISDEGIYCRRRFALTAAAQRAMRVGNVIMRLHHPRIPNPAHRSGVLSALYLARPLIGYEYSRRLHGAGRTSLALWLAHARNVAMDPFETGGFLLNWLRRRTLAARKLPSIVARSKAGLYSVDVNAEQLPNRDSRVQLAAVRDALGMPRIRIDWRYCAGDIATVRRAVAALAEDIAASGCGVLRYDPNEIEADMLRDGAAGGHHIGTTRMAASPRDGVVDADCRVHGIGNLFIASSAVFPTSSHANPTLTIVALALRLADRLGVRPPVQEVGRRVPVTSGVVTDHVADGQA